MTRDGGVSEASLAREVFGPLGGIVALGATAEGGVPVAVGAFVAVHRAELDRLLALIREIGAFGEDTMAIVEELGWHREHDATPFLPMWAGFVEGFPADTGDPAVVRRMVETGADLQLPRFLHALVAAAVTRRTAVAPAAGAIAEALLLAGALLGGAEPRQVLRAWRAAFLVPVLRPDAPVPEEIRDRWRACARALEAAFPDRSGPVLLAVERVGSSEDGAVVCVVRSLSGTAVPGMALDVEVAGAGLRLDRIWRYARETGQLDPPHTARIRLSGPGVPRVRVGARLRGDGAVGDV